MKVPITRLCQEIWSRYVILYHYFTLRKSGQVHPFKTLGIHFFPDNVSQLPPCPAHKALQCSELPYLGSKRAWSNRGRDGKEGGGGVGRGGGWWGVGRGEGVVEDRGIGKGNSATATRSRVLLVSDKKAWRNSGFCNLKPR